MGVEVDGSDSDQQGCVDAGGACGACGCGGGYASEGGSEEEVGRAEEVVGVPLGEGVSGMIWGGGERGEGGGEGGKGRKREGGRQTMSSGSSGRRVTVPEPSRSMDCFMRRMVGGWGWV